MLQSVWREHCILSPLLLPLRACVACVCFDAVEHSLIVAWDVMPFGLPVEEACGPQQWAGRESMLVVIRSILTQANKQNKQA